MVGFQSGVIHLAMTFGRAVVACDVGDLGSALDDGGIMVPPGGAERLAEAMETVVSDRDQAMRLGAAGRRRTLEHSAWSTVAGAN